MAELGRLKSQIISYRRHILKGTKFQVVKTIDSRKCITVHCRPLNLVGYQNIIVSKQMPWNESGVLTDEDGRLLMVKGTLGHQKVTLVNVNLPKIK